MTGEKIKPRRGGRREEILAVAREAFSQKSYGEVTIAAITSKAGVAKGTFYLYFRGKEELFLEVIRDAAQRLRRALGEALDGLEDPLERVRVSVPVIFATCRRETGLYLAIFQRTFSLDSKRLEEHNALFEPLARDFQATIEDGVRRGIFKTGDPQVLSHGVFGFLASLIHRWLLLTSQGDVPPGYLEEMAETAGRFFAYGLTGEPFPPPGEVSERVRALYRRQLEEVKALRRELARIEELLSAHI